eukprot:TRINITY_DN5505_c0_g1_i2.p1 TRINITY_DN5505_c0_g1~~TRINITY_DN5505_c0_g1_i2.p1  ORF type:complete len:173 (+),score=22.27 TRINITY_DN5505_c0_g1_i2:234-752(+)
MRMLLIACLLFALGCNVVHAAYVVNQVYASETCLASTLIYAQSTFVTRCPSGMPTSCISTVAGQGSQELCMVEPFTPLPLSVMLYTYSNIQNCSVEPSSVTSWVSGKCYDHEMMLCNTHVPKLSVCPEAACGGQCDVEDLPTTCTLAKPVANLPPQAMLYTCTNRKEDYLKR